MGSGCGWDGVLYYCYIIFDDNEPIPTVGARKILTVKHYVCLTSGGYMLAGVHNLKRRELQLPAFFFHFLFLPKHRLSCFPGTRAKHQIKTVWIALERIDGKMHFLCTGNHGGDTTHFPLPFPELPILPPMFLRKGHGKYQFQNKVLPCHEICAKSLCDRLRKRQCTQKFRETLCQLKT
jgi:hypothetical protein